MIKLNDITITPTIFPDGTSQVWKIDLNILNYKGLNEISWDFSSEPSRTSYKRISVDESEIFHLCQLVTLLMTYKVKYSLKMDYLPYGRQDKVVRNNSTFSLGPFANIINGLKFESVTTVDPHSKMFLTWVERSREISPYLYILKAIKETQSEVLVFPDDGAVKRYQRMFPDIPYVYGVKVREQISGNIEKYRLVNPDKVDLKNKKTIIIDDICDGGRTFVECAKLLMAEKTLYRHLYVTHGIFSKGIQVLKRCDIDDIYTMKGKVDEKSE